MNVSFKPFALLAILVTASVWSQEAKKTYCRLNVHYYERVSRGKTEYFASYANYVDSKGGAFIPAGSEVVIGKYRRGFTISQVGSDKTVNFEFHKQRMNMSLDDYKALLLSDKPVSYDKLSKEDQAGIKAGIAKVGMTKDGVKAALGYPAAHETPSLDNDTWTFWRDRFRTMTVMFKDGKVTSVQ